jgi:hypothetical protein
MGHHRGFEGRLATAVAIAACLLLAAPLLWIPAFGLADPADCPKGPRTGEGRYVPTGLDVPRSFWPPGVDCSKISESADRSEVAEIFPGVRWMLASLIVGAVLALLGGVLAEIRDLRRNRRDSISGHPPPRRDAGVET